MTDIALTEWEHQPHVLNVLTSREMGEWLCRRENRLLDKIRAEIDSHCSDNRDRNDGLYIAMKIIDKYRGDES